MNYDHFAEVYEEIMDKELYNKWADYVEKNIYNNSSILELGCGSGHLGILLKQHGYSMTGLDLSTQMLTLAKNNQVEQSIHYPLIERDMKNLSDLSVYDSVISFNDSLCYLENEQELAQVFTEVYKVLKNDGLFLFDVHSIYQMELFKDFSFHSELKNTVFIWDSFEGEYNYSVEHELSFFIKQSNGLYERVNELHKERTYPLKMYKNLLKEAGFEVLSVTGDFTNELESTDKRWFFKAIKRG